MSRHYPRIFAVFAACIASVSFADAATTNKFRFNQDIRPILSDNCFACHGPDKATRKAKLRLDVRELALEKEAFMPGKPDESELIKRIFTSDPDDLMPPADSHKKLTARQKNILKQWIAQGAEYEPHWAYIKPVRVPPPNVKETNWVANPIDAFTLRALEVKKIKPSPEADKRALLRRLSLDLIGLPPTSEEVQTFLKDKNPRAYEKQVDRLLASPHFGERMAVPWLDVVRYADTVGYHGDQNQNIFPYRDYVINAFNKSKPFDQFTIEQIAGDLLPNPTTEQKIATGFNRLNMMTREGGAQAKEYIAKYQADRVRTVSGAWLGSTMGCAECHDHKYDPFSTKDFYQMEAFFADVKQWGYYADAGYSPNPDLKGFGNDHPFPPEIRVESPYLKQRIAKLQQRVDEQFVAAEKRLKADAQAKKDFNAWRDASRKFLKESPSGWAIPKPEVTLKFKDANIVAQTNFTVQTDGTVSFSENTKESTTLKLPVSPGWLAGVRLEIVPQELKGEAKRLPQKKRQGTAVTVTAALKSKDGKETKLPFHFGEADAKEERFVNGSMGLPVLGVTDIWQISPEHDQQTAVWLLDKPVKVSDGDVLVVNLGNAAVASARVSFSPFAAEHPLRSGVKLFKEDPRRSFLLSTHWNSNSIPEIRTTLAQIRECRGGIWPTMVTEQRAEPLLTRVLPRGNWQDESGEIVQPAVPHFLPQIFSGRSVQTASTPSGGGDKERSEGQPPAKVQLARLDLAKWLVSKENPLTARTVMNRYWKEFFGRGLSAVVDDLGAQGEPPSHPELLDWLACEFMDSGWSVKHMVKLMVMSSTYRQSSNLRPELKDIDPSNRLLASQNPRRLEAEFVRDNALFIAGLLNKDLGGPSARPYQPPGYYANLQFPDRDYVPDKDERQYRRGVYVWWQRTFLQPMMANFDAPQREECTGARVVSSTPQQALTLLNDPTFVEASRVFAQQILRDGSPGRLYNDAQRLDRAFELALARPGKEKEKASLLKFLETQREFYRSNDEDSKKLLKVGLAPLPTNSAESELAAWTQVCRVILNLHETITRY